MTEQLPTIHSPWHDWLPLYVAGTLPSEKRAAVENHLAACADCRILADQWKQVASVVRTDAAARADRLLALNRTLFVSPNPTKERPFNMTTHTVSAKPRTNASSIFGIAALVVLIAGLMILLRQPIQPPAFGGQANLALVASPTLTEIPPTSTPDLTVTAVMADLYGRPVPVAAVTATALSNLSIEHTLTDGKPVSDQLTAAKPQAIYQYTAPDTGLLAIYTGSDNFKPHLSYYQLDAKPIIVIDNGVTISTSVTVYDHVQKGERIAVMVSSDSASELGSFSINAALALPIPLTYGQPFSQQIVVPPDVPSNPAVSNGFHYYSFDAKAGDTINVKVKSDNNLDLTMYMQGFTPETDKIPLFNSSTRHTCLDTVPWQQCYDDDSGGGTDPELNHIVVSQDRHFDVVVSGFGLFTRTVNYQITVTKNDPVPLGAGEALMTSLSWKIPQLSFRLIAQKGKTIPIRLSNASGAKYPIVLIATQDNQPIGYTKLEYDPITTLLSPIALSVTPISDDPVQLFVEYADVPRDGSLTTFQITRENP